MPRPTQPLVRFELRLAKRALRHQLFEALRSEAELERIELHPLTEDGPAAGSRPQTVMSDPRGRHYLFKLAA